MPWSSRSDFSTSMPESFGQSKGFRSSYAWISTHSVSKYFSWSSLSSYKETSPESESFKPAGAAANEPPFDVFVKQEEQGLEEMSLDGDSSDAVFASPTSKVSFHATPERKRLSKAHAKSTPKTDSKET